MLLLKTVFIFACALVLVVATNSSGGITKEPLTMPTLLRASGSTKIDGLLQKRQQTCVFGPGSAICINNTCCRPGDRCCSDDGCCLSTERCVGSPITIGCCPLSATVCSDEVSCCRSGTTCCGSGCCPEGTICSLNKCINSSSSSTLGFSQTTLTFLGLACATILSVLL